MINKSNITLSEWISTNQNIGTIPSHDVNKSDIAYLSDLSKIFNKSTHKLFGLLNKHINLTNKPF